MRNVDLLANAIATAEGFIDKSGTVLSLAPARRNNPGSLRASSFAAGTDAGGYSVFASAVDGWRGLYRQIGLDRDRNLTVREFVYKFAPPSENRTESYYLPLVLNMTGFGPDQKLGALIEDYPTQAPVLPATLPGVGGAVVPPVVRVANNWASFGASWDLSSIPGLELSVGVIAAALALVLFQRA